MNSISSDLINEIKEVQKKVKEIIQFNNLHKNEYKSIEECLPHGVVEYTIITNNSIVYIINELLKETIDFDASDIVYVHKHFNCSMPYKNWDNINGFYNDYNILYNTVNKFQITQQINDWYG